MPEFSANWLNALRSSMSAAFDKDRAADYARLRGADAHGRLADVLQIEVPHAFAMVLTMQPALELCSARYTRYGERGPAASAVLCADLSPCRLRHLATPGGMRKTARRRKPGRWVLSHS